MSVLDIIALLLLVMITLLIGVLFWYLGGLPGRVAKERHHPNEQAVAVGGWATLILGGIGWPFVLMWAYASLQHSDSEERSASQSEELRKEINSLHTQIESLTKQVQSQGGAK